MPQQTRPSVVVLGGINMDLVTITPRFPEAGETVVGSRFLIYPGGKGANQAIAAARMGASVDMVGRVGDDVFGPQLLGSLAAGGVDVSGVAVTPGHSSGISVISIDESAQNRIIQVLGAINTYGEAEAAAVRRALANASTLLLQLEVPVDLSFQVAQEAAAQGKTVILDPGPPRPIPSEFYPHCHVITPNETEAQALVGFPVMDETSAARAAGELLSRGAGSVVVKLGSRGAYWASPEGQQYVPPFRVQAVDTVGAGDAFNGVLAVALAEGSELAHAVPIAAAAGALAVTKSGAQEAMPTRQEVEALLRSQRPG